MPTSFTPRAGALAGDLAGGKPRPVLLTPEDKMGEGASALNLLSPAGAAAGD